jgi:hypothetical protein
VARSRKRSGSSDTSKLPESPVFFVDRCLGRRAFPEPLRECGLLVELHDDHFDVAAPDEEWLSEVGRRGWIVLTRDLRIRYRAIEREAALANGVRMISLTARRLAAEELGRAFAASIDRVINFLTRHPRPFIATMGRTGDLRIVKERGAPGRSPS